MAEFIPGPLAVCTWTYSGGTLNLAPDLRRFTWTPLKDFADTTAGADTSKGRLPTITDATANVDLVGQTSATNGTAFAAGLAAGQAGTLIYGPEGTATGKRKITFPAYSNGAVTDYPYNDVVTITCGFTGDGSVLGSFTDGVY